MRVDQSPLAPSSAGRWQPQAAFDDIRRAEAEKAIKKAQHVEEMVDRLAELKDAAPERKAIAFISSPEHSIELDDEIARQAQAVLATTDVSPSAIVQKMFARIAGKGVLPSELFEPNAETVAAMEAADPGEVVTVGTIEEMFAELKVDD